LANGLAIAGTRHLRLPTANFALTNMLRDPAPEVRRALREAAQYIDLPGLIARSKTQALDGDLAIDERVLAVRSLRGGRFADVSPVLAKILATPAPQQIQAEAAHTLSAFSEKEVSAILLSGWKGYGPEARRAATAALLEFRDRAAALLDAIDQGQVEVASIDPVDRIRLTQFPAPDIQDRAKKLFKAQTSDREKVVAEFQDVLKLTPNAGHGKQVFEDHCAKCHLSRGERARIGPDLSGVNNKTTAELLTHILDPSFEIQPNYTNYLVVDNFGRMYDGLLVGETEHTVKLRGELEDVTIPRKSITEMRASSVSLMPDGLENEMSRQDLADVIAYLRAGL
jgi:putative heme-binding domain-containing protein